MYTGESADYKATIEKYNRRFAARLKKNSQVLDVNIKEYTLSKISSSGDDFTIGYAFSSSLEIQYIGSDLKNSEVILETGMELSTGYSYIPDGAFTIISSKTKENIITATGYDRMYVYGSKIFEVTQFPDALSNMAADLAEQLGTTFDTSCISSSDDLQVTTMPENCTLQNLAGYLAGLLGRNAYIDRSGKLTFQAYKNGGFTFDGSRISDIDLDPTARTIDCLKCTISESSNPLESGTGTGYITMQNPLMTQTILDQVTAKISGSSYYGAVVPFLLGDNRLDPWDIITYSRNGKEYPILCHEILTSFDGGLQMNVTSYALSESEQNGYKGPLQQEIEEIKKETQKSVKSASITADTYVFKYSAGTLVGADRANLTAAVQNVSISRWQYLNESGTWTDYPQTSENSSITGNTLVVCPDHAVFVGDTAQIKLLTDDSEVFDTLTITKLSDGVDGADGADGSDGSDGTGGLSVIIGNEAQTIACDSDGAVVEDTTVEIPFTGYTGIDQIACTCSRVGDLPSGVSILKNTAATTSTSGLISFKFASGATLGGAENGSIDLEFTLSGKKVTKQFSWSKSTAGENGSSYILESDVQIVKKGADDVLSPNSITFSAYYRDGSSAERTAYSGRFKIYESITDTDTDSWSLKYTSRSDQSSKTHTISTSDVKYIKCILYASGGTTTELASITVNVIEDAEGAVDEIDQMLTQKEIFNRLTNNGEAQGFYYDESTGDLYINATYIVSGILSSLGGESWINLEDGTFKLVKGSLENVNLDEIKVGGCVAIRLNSRSDGFDLIFMPDDGEDGAYAIFKGITVFELGAIFSDTTRFDCKTDFNNIATYNSPLLPKAGSYVHNATGTSGSTGYVKVAELKITGTYCNVPIIFHVLQRGCEESILSILFSSVNSTDPTIKAFDYQGQPAYLVKSATSTWGLYIQKSEAYDQICISQYHLAPYMASKITVTWTNVHASSLPSGYTTSTAYVPGDSGWITVSSLSNSFTQYSSATWAVKCGYRKIGNHVYVRGHVTTPSSWDGTTAATVFTLPSGYRPSGRTYTLNAMTGSRIARVFVDTDGRVILEWTRNISDASVATGSLAWVDITVDFLID